MSEHDLMINNSIIPALVQQRIAPNINRIRGQDAPYMDDLVRKGIWATVLFFGSLLIWSLWAPLTLGVHATGVVAVKGNIKTVQHLEGGIVQAMFVQNGERVKAGALLLQLDDKAPRAQVEQLRDELGTLLTLRSRLEAERMGSATVNFDARLATLELPPGKLELLKREQRDGLTTRRLARGGEKSILASKAQDVTASRADVEHQLAGMQRQLDNLDQEVSAAQELYDKGLERKPHLLGLQRQREAMLLQVSELHAKAASGNENLAQLHMQNGSIDIKSRDDVFNQLTDIDVRLADRLPHFYVARDTLVRTKIVAPTDGIVMNLHQQTIGGVLAPGEPLLDIVPENKPLLAEVHISPRDVDKVRVGMPSKVYMSGFSQRTTKPLLGTVAYVSPSSMEDRGTGAPRYYLAQISIPPTQWQTLGKAKVVPGMPVQALIVAGDRPIVDTLFDPLIAGFRSAFTD